MAYVQSAIKEAERYKGKINPRYDLILNAYMEIEDNCSDIHDIISTAFAFGYAQGTKAEKSRLKREEKSV